MGTTKDAITNGDNPTLAFVLALEGYTNLISTWGNTAAVVTAWAATDYGAAIAGLRTPGVIEQSIEPFRARIEANSIQLTILPDADDTFGVDVFATNKSGGAHAYIDLDRDVNDNISVGDASDFAASGAAYIGTERFEYSSISSNDFVSTRGKPVPFNRDGGAGFARPHKITDAQGVAVGKPEVTDYPKRWIGKWMGLWAHRVVDGVLDVQAQAQLIWSGKLADIADQGGATVLTGIDSRDVVNQTLLGEQWEAVPSEGVRINFFSAGHAGNDIFKIRQWWINNVGTAVPEDWKKMEADGTYISSGKVTADEYISALNDFFDAQTWSTASDWTTATLGSGNILTIRSELNGTNIAQGRLEVVMSRNIAGLLGFDLDERTEVSDFNLYYTGPTEDDASSKVIAYVAGSLPTAYCRAVPDTADPSGSTSQIDYDTETGTWIDQGDNVPEPMRTTYTTTTGSWGFVEFRGYTYLAKKASGNVLGHWDPDIGEIFRQGDPESQIPRGATRPQRNSQYVRTTEILPRIKQVVLFAEDSFSDWVIKSFASTGSYPSDASTYNNATWDTYHEELSLAVPWDLLGTAFVASAETLDADARTFVVLIEKPTKFADILLPELALRNAHLAMADGKLVFVKPEVIDAAGATHTLTTSHKAAQLGSGPDWPDYHRSRETIIPEIKVEFERDLLGNYNRVLNITNEQAKTDAGGGYAAPLTIKARNSLQLRRGMADQHTRQLIAELAADVLAYYSSEHPVVERSVAAAKWFMTPGDSVSLTDNWVRSATTGARSITSVPGWVLSVSQNWQTMIGETTMVLHNQHTDTVTYSPAGKIDTALGADNGYTAGTPAIFLEANEFSLASEADDITHFEVGDVIDIVEISPATPGSPTKWQRTIDAIDAGSQEITLDSALSSPAWDNTLTYYVYSAVYGSAQSSQQSHAYIGDDTDAKIVDTIPNRKWGSSGLSRVDVTDAVSTDRPEWPPTDGQWHTEGESCHPAMHRNAVYAANNLVNRRTAVGLPMYFVSEASTTQTSYRLACFPFKVYIGRGIFSGRVRKFTFGPTVTGAGKVRITSSRLLPRSTDALSGEVTIDDFPGISTNQEWTGTSGYQNLSGAKLAIETLPGADWTWITIEIQATSGTFTLEGLHECWLGPLE